jgi:hypothetical protein
MYSLALIIFVVSEKKAFEHFPIGSNVNLCPAVVAILDFQYGKNVSKCFFSETTWKIETKLPSNDHWKVLYKVYVFLCRSKIPSGFREEAFRNFFPMGSNIKLSPAVAANLNFISEQKT